MATIIVTTSMEFTEEESRSFVEKTGEVAVAAFHLPKTLRDVYLYTIETCRQTPHDGGQITFFIYTAPGKPIEYKREMVQGMQRMADEFFAGRKVNTVVIIKEHPDENVGAGGTLRFDAQAGN